MCVFICSRQETGLRLPYTNNDRKLAPDRNLALVEFLTPTMPRDFPKSIGSLEPRKSFVNCLYKSCIVYDNVFPMGHTANFYLI